MRTNWTGLRIISALAAVLIITRLSHVPAAAISVKAIHPPPSPSRTSKPDPVLDSMVTEFEAIAQERCPGDIREQMRLVEVSYLGFDGERHLGQIVVHGDLAEEVKLLFDQMEELRFPIERVIPISQYGWDDEASMTDNNTSAFNYRQVNVPGKRLQKLSLHSYGRAIDLNPKLNPFINAHGSTPGTYDPSVPGTLTEDHPVVRLFESYGWRWGGHWQSGPDYQHFEKALP